MIACGSACLACDFPIHIDTYRGCSHACKYCFANEKKDIRDIKVEKSSVALKKFIEGKRNNTTKPFDWDIPLHWGGNSDPFQPCEADLKESLACLKIFAETGYPFIVSTKGALIAQEPYLSLIGQANAVVQISMTGPTHDKLELGAPPYEQRLRMVEKLAPKARRVLIRLQPFFLEDLNTVLKEIPRYAEEGAYGCIVSSYASNKKRAGMIKNGGDYTYPDRELLPRYTQIKKALHENGMRFFCGDAWLRWLGDDLTCCGTEGLEGFVPATYNTIHMAFDKEKPEPTQAMHHKNNGWAFKARKQESKYDDVVRKHSYAELMELEGKPYVEHYRNLRKKYSKYDKLDL